MSWNETSLERHVRERLTAELGPERAMSLFSRYIAARDKVLNEIKQIPGVEPSLSDHGPDHIANVMDCAFGVISSDPAVHQLTGIDLYVLSLVILFHDVGNLFGRENHHQRIGGVFDWARGTGSDARRERTLVIRAAQAHTGRNTTGGRNTLVEVEPIEHLDGHQVQLRNIAAVLRLSDELAEGPQRTTDYYRTVIGYEPEAAVYHQYAACTNVAADRANQRIRLTYEIHLDDFASAEPDNQRDSLAKFLEFVLHRVGKLDDERRYARFYCAIFFAFKQTDVSINFTSDGLLLPLNVRFQLDDLVVPGDHALLTESRFKDKCKLPAALAADVVEMAKSRV